MPLGRDSTASSDAENPSDAEEDDAMSLVLNPIESPPSTALAVLAAPENNSPNAPKKKNQKAKSSSKAECGPNESERVAGNIV